MNQKTTGPNVDILATTESNVQERHMNTRVKQETVTREDARPISAEQQLKERGIDLPAPPRPLGIYAEAVRTGNLLFLTGMRPTAGRGAQFVGRMGVELDVEEARQAADLALLIRD